MAAIGLQQPHFALFKGDEPEDALPIYDTVTKLGKAVSANLTVNLANGDFYADDVLAENVSEFVSGALKMETDDLTDEVLESILGAKRSEDGELAFNINDVYPFCGIGYYKKLMRNGKVSYRAYFLPKCKASPVDDNGQTKGTSVTFQTSTVNFTIYAPNVGNWRYNKTFPTAAEALAWIKKKLGASAALEGGS